VQGVVPPIEESKNNYIKELVNAGVDQKEAEELVQLWINSDSNPVVPENNLDVAGNDLNIADNLDISDNQW